MVAAVALRLGLPEVVQQRRQAHLERRPGVGGRLDDGEDVLVERQVLAVALLLVADRRRELGQHVDEHAGVPREPQRLRRMRAEQELRELPHPVRRQPAADPLARDVLDPRRPLAHLAQRVLVGIDVELRDEAEAADDPERVVAEARRPGRAEDAPLEVGAAAERVEDLPRLEPPRDRVDREVAPLHVLLERDLAVGDDLEVVPARAGRALDTRRRELDPGRLQRPRRLVPRQQPHADALVGDDEILDLAVRLERRPQLGVADARDDEVELRRRPPEQLVADGAADEVGVEPERMHVVGDRVPHGRHSAPSNSLLLGRAVRCSRAPDLLVTVCCKAQSSATASISTSAPEGSFATSTVERAGGASPTWAA